MGEAATFELEAAATRERMAETINDLQARLSPKALVDSAVTSINDVGAEAFASVRGAALGHPWAIAAAGLAVGIALLARSKVRSATIEYGDSYAAYADYDEGYAANLAEDDAPVGSTRARIDALHHKAHEAVDGNPMLVVVAGLAAGAVIGGLMPVSDLERGLLAQASARLAAAGDAAIAAAKAELDVSKFSLAGGTTGIADRAVQSLLTVVEAAGDALQKTPPRTRLSPHSAA